MLGGLLTVLRLVWPFLKESILEGGTVAEWIRRNRMSCFWIFLLLANLVAMFFLADLLIASQQTASAATQKVQTLTTKYNGLVIKYNYQLGQTKLERNRVAQLRRLIANSCPVDSEAYKVLVAGIETLDTPTTGPDQSVEWCKVVQSSDLDKPQIRERFLMECGKSQP